MFNFNALHSKTGPKKSSDEIDEFCKLEGIDKDYILGAIKPNYKNKRRVKK